MATKRLALAKQLERDVVFYMVQDSRFHARVGHALLPDMLTNEHAQLVVELALAFYRETGGSTSMGATVVAQRLRTLREIGRLTKEDADDVFDWLDEVCEGEHAPRDAVINELARELKRYLEGVAIMKAMDAHGKRSSTREAAELFAKAEKLGKFEESSGSSWDDDDDERVVKPVKVDRLPTGIIELDEHMKGGIRRGEMTCALGDTGAGKSLLLSQIAASAMQAGHNPLIITLEVTEEIWKARLKAACSDVQTDLILEGELTDRDRDQIKRARGGQLAQIVYMSPNVTTVEDVWRVFDEANQELEKKGSDKRYDVLIVDYGDKLGYPKHFGNKYDGQGFVFDSLMHGGRERNIWTWTAAAAKRREKKHGKDRGDGLLRSADVGDSLNKVRNVDVVITINPSSDRTTVRVLLDKNRTGEANYCTEHLPTDYAHGRLVQNDNLENDRPFTRPEDAMLPFG
jgi:RecA/RadA recombinase